MKASFSIYFSYIYVNPTNKTSFLSILITNEGATNFTITSFKVGNETIKLPVEGMTGTNKVKFASQSYLEVPLTSKWVIGKSYDLSVTTDPPANYTKVKTLATLVSW